MTGAKRCLKTGPRYRKLPYGKRLSSKSGPYFGGVIVVVTSPFSAGRMVKVGVQIAEA